MGTFVSTASGLEDILPLSPLQEGLYFQTLLREGGPDFYTSQFIFDLRGPVDPAAIRSARAGITGPASASALGVPAAA